MKALIPILIIFLFSGCWTVNKFIEKHPKRYQATTDTFVIRGGCKPTILKRDTIYHDSTIHDTTSTTDSFTIHDCNLDTVVGPLHLRIREGKLWYHISITDTKKVKIPVVIQNVEDSTRIGVLQKQLSVKSDSLKSMKESEKVLKEKVKTANVKFYMIVAVLVLALILYELVRRHII